MSEIVTIKSITEAHQLLGIEKPVHPLISVFKHTPDMNTDITGVLWQSQENKYRIMI